jgi:hypothetical protein
MDELQLAQIMSKARVLIETGFFDEVYYTENNAMPPDLDLDLFAQPRRPLRVWTG